MNQNLYNLFEARFPADDTPCLRLADGSVVTYGDLEARTGRVANLLTDLGARPGDRVAVQVEKSAEAVALYLGCLRAGCVFLPINPAYQSAEVAHLLGDAQPAVFVCRPQALAESRRVAVEAGVPQVLALDDDGSGEWAERADACPVPFETALRAEDDLASILYTSGTTGRPKGAMLSHRNLTVGVQVLHKAWGFRPDDRLLHILPIFHVHGLFVALHTALWNGSEMWFESRFDPRRAVELLGRSTVCMGVPTHYVRLLAEPALTPAACDGMRLFISGSAPLLADTFVAFRERTGHTILERYGMTEGGMFVSNPLDGERRCGTVGLPLPGMSVRVVDAEGHPAVAGVTGHIEVKGPNVFVGYWKLPDKTAEEHTADGYFKTGDLGTLSIDGYLTIVGRSKDLIISGGLNVYPKEVEEVIDGLTGVRESAVVGVPHADFGEAVTAVVTRDPSVLPPIEGQQIIDGVKARLAAFKVPKTVVFLDDLPRNAMGKVQKALLRERLQLQAVRS